jgi:hypothetical protein
MTYSIVKIIATPLGFVFASVVSFSTLGYIIEDAHNLHISQIRKEYDVKLQKLDALEKENTELKATLNTFLRTKIVEL